MGKPIGESWFSMVFTWDSQLMGSNNLQYGCFLTSFGIEHGFPHVAMYSDGPLKDKKWNLRTQFANIRVYVYVLIHMLTYTCMYIEYISMLYVHLEPQ
jgi:hypothetical protein